MRLKTLTRTLLLGVALGASPSVLAAEIAAPAERLGDSVGTLRPSAARELPDSWQQRRGEKSKNKDGKGATDKKAVTKKRSASADSGTGGAGEAVPDNVPPAEPQSIALRGVRG